mmetsp:Transcript_34923/g.86868  ORF Transcript_34923/g.86868 Transcript_34923/m.86868 type:complete len:97 (-) Transcript_34923:4697-4987(-)
MQLCRIGERVIPWPAIADMTSDKIRDIGTAAAGAFTRAAPAAFTTSIGASESSAAAAATAVAIAMVAVASEKLLQFFEFLQLSRKYIASFFDRLQL